MGLGVLSLVNVGREDLFLTGSPEITYFKVVYKRYTNYAIEEIPQYFKSIPDFGRRCTVHISKNADLVSSLFLYIELPSIQLENLNTWKQFAWAEKIGLAIIKSVEIEIGGNIIDRHYNDWLNMWFELFTQPGHVKGLNKMIGNTKELCEFSETKNKTILYIPLIFWFCLDSGLSLPLISLNNSDIKIHIEFSDIDACYKLNPMFYIKVSNYFCLFKKGEIMIQSNSNASGEFVYFDTINRYLYYNSINSVFIIPEVDNDDNLKIIGQKSNFTIYIQPGSIIIKDIDYFKYNKPSLVNSYILVNYIYLDQIERNKFYTSEHEYLVQLVQTIPEHIAYTQNISYKIPFYNPSKFILWRIIPISNRKNNCIFQYKNLISSRPLINKNLIVLNSINSTELNSIEYYTTLPMFQYKMLKNATGIYIYSFSIKPTDIQPTGSLNFSHIDNSYILMQLDKDVTYQNPYSIKAFSLYYNILRINHGIGSLVFDN